MFHSVDWKCQLCDTFSVRRRAGEGREVIGPPPAPRCFPSRPLSFLALPATSAVTSAAATAASARNGLTLFLWGASGAQRGVSCNAQGVGRLKCLNDYALLLERGRPHDQESTLGGRLPCLFTSYLVVASEEFHFANAPVLRSGLNSF